MHFSFIDKFNVHGLKGKLVGKLLWKYGYMEGICQLSQDLGTRFDPSF